MLKFSDNQAVVLLPFEQTATNFQIIGIAPEHQAYWIPATGLSLSSMEPEHGVCTPDDLCVTISPAYTGHFDQLRDIIRSASEITLCVKNDSVETAMIGLLLRQWQIMTNYYVMSADDVSPLGLLEAWHNRQRLSDLSRLAEATTMAIQGIALLDEGITRALRQNGSRRSYSILRAISMDEYRINTLPTDGADVTIELSSSKLETLRAISPVSDGWIASASDKDIELSCSALPPVHGGKRSAYTTDELVSDMLRTQGIKPSDTLRCLQVLCESESLITHPITVSGNVPIEVYNPRLLTQMCRDYPLLEGSDVPPPSDNDTHGCGIIPVNTYASTRAAQLGREYKIIYRAICTRYVETCLGNPAPQYIDLTCVFNQVRCRGIVQSTQPMDDTLTGRILDVVKTSNAGNKVSPDNWHYLNGCGYCAGKYPMPRSPAFAGQLDRGMVRFTSENNSLSIPDYYLDGLPEAITDATGLCEWIGYLLSAKHTNNPREIMINWLAFVKKKIAEIV